MRFENKTRDIQQKKFAKEVNFFLNQHRVSPKRSRRLHRKLQSVMKEEKEK